MKQLTKSLFVTKEVRELIQGTKIGGVKKNLSLSLCLDLNKFSMSVPQLFALALKGRDKDHFILVKLSPPSPDDFSGGQVAIFNSGTGLDHHTRLSNIDDAMIGDKSLTALVIDLPQ